MKGILKHTTAGWYIWYQVMKDEITSGYESLPLHPKYEKYYFLDNDADGGEVEFEIVKETYDDGSECKYAKLINHENSAKQDILDMGKDTADYIDRHIIESMKELAKEGFKPKLSEISDEEIEKAFTIETAFQTTKYMGEIRGAKWYREQLKNK
jgi:hypothetical protein